MKSWFFSSRPNRVIRQVAPVSCPSLPPRRFACTAAVLRRKTKKDDFGGPENGIIPLIAHLNLERVTNSKRTELISPMVKLLLSDKCK